MLQPGEEILLEAEVQGMVGSWRRMPPGRAYLTPQRIIWLRPEGWISRCLWGWGTPLMPGAFSIWIADIRNVIRGGALWVVTDKQRVTLGLGRGPFIWPIRDNAATINEWFEAIQRLRSGGSSSAEETTSSER